MFNYISRSYQAAVIHNSIHQAAPRRHHKKRNGANMTKSELIDRLCMRYPQLRSQDVEETVKLIIEKICQSLEKGDRVEIRGFGSFSLHYREARTGRNPKTGESVEVPAKSIPYFRAGKELRERVDENDA
ncbi:integration host factor subunit beta [Cardiobacterium valvarum]|uniref:integration host factor subunit beta n=1 Tax=Cardiobacterium valvarum TaxID=194702 RepID=UPI00155874C8|nr:integration host factor subunit beta [Cardiobacterium valvarum]